MNQIKRQIRLTRQFKQCDLGTLTDTLAIWMANVENAMLLAGARPTDYTHADLMSWAVALLTSSAMTHKEVTLEDIEPTRAVRLTDNISGLNLSMRAWNCLNGERIETIGQLVGRTSVELSRIPNLGEVSLREIREALTAVGLTLKAG